MTRHSRIILALNSLSKRKHNLLPFGIQGQLLFSCGVLFCVMLICGSMLSMVSHETMQDYHNSLNTISTIYELNTSLDNLDATMTDYVLNQTDLARSNCENQWRLLGHSFQAFYPAESESLLLIWKNIRSIYQNSQQNMELFLNTQNKDVLLSLYETLMLRKEGMSFLLDQMLRQQTEMEVINYPGTLSRNVKSTIIFVVLLVISLLFLIASSIRMIHIICGPIDLLVADAKEIAAGKYDTPDINIINDDEMGYLSQVFNDMKKHVAENFKHMEQIIELQELLQSTELKALQAQINPHFLFNVLAVAEEAALYEDANQTVEIIEDISYMLQYSLKCTKQDVTLPEELRMVKSYLALQEKRFGDRLQISFSAPPSIPPLLIPGTSLQPIVENAFLHGVEHMEYGGSIRVHVATYPNYIEVTVADNGRGIESSILKSILRQEQPSCQPTAHGIGLINVMRRMEVFYNQKDLISISSHEQRGTTVIVRYPLLGGNSSNVQSTDRR